MARMRCWSCSPARRRRGPRGDRDRRPDRHGPWSRRMTRMRGRARRARRADHRHQQYGIWTSMRVDLAVTEPARGAGPARSPARSESALPARRRRSARAACRRLSSRFGADEGALPRPGARALVFGASRCAASLPRRIGRRARIGGPMPASSSCRNRRACSTWRGAADVEAARAAGVIPVGHLRECRMMDVARCVLELDLRAVQLHGEEGSGRSRPASPPAARRCQIGRRAGGVAVDGAQRRRPAVRYRSRRSQWRHGPRFRWTLLNGFPICTGRWWRAASNPEHRCRRAARRVRARCRLGVEAGRGARILPSSPPFRRPSPCFQTRTNMRLDGGSALLAVPMFPKY